MAAARETLRLAIIASTVVSAALLVLLGIPRAQVLLTPQIQRVWVASAALGDRAASIAARDALAGTPVTLYAIVQARSRFGGESVLYGTVPTVILQAGEPAVALAPWKDWWLQPEFLWSKVEPMLPFANETFDAGFRASDIGFSDSYQVSWGFSWSHALDIRASGDAYPDWGSGTMRFSARAVIRDRRDRILQQVSAAAAEQVHAAAPDERPHRVTVRAGDDEFGRMLGFAGLPYVPVSPTTPMDLHPVNLRVGGTVLDFWMAAQRQDMKLTAAPDWERLEENAEIVVADMFLGADGNYYHAADPRRAVDWRTVRAGDLLAIEDHVGILYEDRGPGGGGDGLLNSWDRALEAYFEPLRDTALGDAFVADIRIYRLRQGGLGR